MDAGSEALHDGAIRSLNLTNVGVGRDSVEDNRTKVVTNAFEFTVSVDVADFELTRFVELDGLGRLTEDGIVQTISRHGNDGPIADVARDGAEEWQALNKKEVDTKSDLPVELEDGRRNGDGRESGDTWGCGGTRGLPLQHSDVGGPVDDEGAASVVWRDRAIVNLSASEDGLESGLVRAANLSIELSSRVGCRDVTVGKHLLLVCNRGQHVVGANVLTIFITCCVENVQAGWVFREYHDRPVETVDAELDRLSGVHGYTANFANISERQDVCNRILIVPHWAKVGKIPDQRRVVLVSPVRDSAENMCAWTNV